jgi:Ni2+-binding GTPase involved in maturation of urease and hydrogenase
MSKSNSTPPARYIMIGGFLGAGKTTSVLKLGQHLRQQGLKVGLITNDQGSRLVDTALLAAHGFPVEEIAGGCFCCRFNSLVDAARKLVTHDRPEVFIAEPVGSCTDLVATVSYPLRRIYGNDFVVAPLTVLVDPLRARRVLGLEPGGNFSEKVRYIYLKQLEEADLIVINKCDAVGPAEKDALRAALAGRFPAAEILEMSARDGTGLQPWMERVTTGALGGRPSLSIDYDIYAEGEALLGWLNATVDLRAAAALDGNQLLRDLARRLQVSLVQQGAEVAHLKMTMDPADGLGELAVINLVRNDFVPELSQEIEEPIEHGQIIVNCRAEAPADLLRSTLQATLEQMERSVPGLHLTLEHIESFQPGRPQPTHRMEVS